MANCIFTSSVSLLRLDAKDYMKEVKVKAKNVKWTKESRESTTRMTFGRKVSEEELRNWGRVAKKEVAVFHENRNSNKENEMMDWKRPRFPDIKQGLKLWKAGLEPVIMFGVTFPYFEDDQKKKAKKKPAMQKISDQLLPPNWYTEGFHKMTLKVMLEPLIQKKKIDNIKDSDQSKAVKNSTNVMNLCRKPPPAKSDVISDETEWKFAMSEEILANDNFDVSKVEDLSHELITLFANADESEEMPLNDFNDSRVAVPPLLNQGPVIPCTILLEENLCDDAFDDIDIQEFQNTSFATLLNIFNSDFGEKELEDSNWKYSMEQLYKSFGIDIENGDEETKVFPV